MAITYTALSQVTIGSGGLTSIEFANIPQSYTDLKVVISARSDRATTFDELKLSFNPPNSNYYEKLLYQADSGAGAASADSLRRFIIISGNNNGANVFGSVEQYIYNYTSSNNKSASTESVNSTTSASSSRNYFQAIEWTDTSPITSIKYESHAGNTLLQHSTATLYGIKNTV